MKSDEIDKIIEEALENDKKKKHKGKKIGRQSDGILTARKILNAVFMLGFLAAVIIYFVFPDQKALFFSVGFGALLLKVIEFYLRFMF
jgi:hypothetical protein